MLSFGKRLCCFESSIATSGAIWYIKDLPYPVGKFTYTSLPLRNSESAFSYCGLRFGTPNVEHTPETALSLVALARDFLPPSWTREFGNKIFLNYSSRANKLARQPIRSTTRFLGSDVTGQHYQPVLSDVSLPEWRGGWTRAELHYGRGN